jgi:hypothetical protein
MKIWPICFILLLVFSIAINSCVDNENNTKILSNELINDTNFSEIETTPEPELKNKAYESFLDDTPAFNLQSPTTIPNPIWYTNSISYSFFSCDNLLFKQKQMRDAFNTASKISNNLIQFKEMNYNSDADISVYCLSASETPKDGRIKTVGLGGPSKYYPINGYSVIVKGRIDIYETQCSGGAMELHELLHVLGFDHVENDSRDLMSPMSDCDSIVKEHTKNDLIAIYSTFKDINKTKIIDYPSEYFN